LFIAARPGLPLSGLALCMSFSGIC
jgi:hypothetical protein